MQVLVKHFDKAYLFRRVRKKSTASPATRINAIAPLILATVEKALLAVDWLPGAAFSPAVSGADVGGWLVAASVGTVGIEAGLASGVGEAGGGVGGDVGVEAGVDVGMDVGGDVGLGVGAGAEITSSWPTMIKSSSPIDPALSWRI